MKHSSVKKISCLILSATLMFNAQAANILLEENSFSENNFYVYENNQPTGVTIQEVNDTISESTEALVQGDMKKYAELSQKLDNMGAEEISFEEVLQLTGENAVSISDNLPEMLAASNSVSFRKTTTKFTQSGKTYDIMQITATPNGSGLLYNTGNTTQTHSQPASAGIKAVGVMAKAAAGELSKKINIAFTIYDVVSAAGNAIKTTSTVKNIRANYTWNVGETCTFIYVFDNNLGSYRLGARYNKASFTIASSIPSITVVGLSPITDVIQHKITDTATALHYGSIPRAVEYANKNATYTGNVGNINFSGLSNQVVKNINLLCPMNPAELGYS